MSAKSKQTVLHRIKTDIVKNNVCPNLAQTATQLVFGDGNPDAEIMFVGEAPGKNEDIIGKPFVGSAGRFLDEMLSLVGMDRQDVYITNIVKYRPPENRDPLPEEKAEFLPYLLEQVEVIKPKLLVTLGRHSMEVFIPGRKISQIHGQPKRVSLGKEKIVVLPLYHPAAALYNGGMREILIEDFAKVPKILKQIN